MALVEAHVPWLISHNMTVTISWLGENGCKILPYTDITIYLLRGDKHECNAE